MIFRVLGSAAGGGVPQWNCACENCNAARAGVRPRRTQSSAAISADGERWVLLNCSPDAGAQIEAFAPLQPHSGRETPLYGIAFTDANVDHMGGLATLRQQGTHRFTLRSTAVVREIASAQPAFAPFAKPPHRWLVIEPGELCEPCDDIDPIGNEITVRAIGVPGLTPGYDGRREVPGAVVAYELTPRQGGISALFAPVFSAIDDTLFAAIARADVAFLDGSFFSDDELIDNDLLDKTARALGHLPMIETLGRLKGLQTRVVFCHVNNSNPALDPDSRASARVREIGAETAYDGMTLAL